MSVLFANELPNIAACFLVVILLKVDVDFLFWLFHSHQRKSNHYMAVIAEFLKASVLVLSSEYLMPTSKEMVE